MYVPIYKINGTSTVSSLNCRPFS